VLIGSQHKSNRGAQEVATVLVNVPQHTAVGGGDDPDKPLDLRRRARDDRGVPELVEPTVAVHASFLAAMQEFADEGRTGDNTMVGRDLAEWDSRWTTDHGFAAYVGAIVRDREEDAPRKPGWVPCTTLWWVDGSAYLGRIAIRHRLTPGLREVGGHIGYDVRPSARRRGHATAMLAAALPVAAGLGVDPALVTCDDTNVGSRKVIEANGGIFADQRGVKLRYWVPTSR
jgi:predicted acetyltransferase